MERQRVSSSSIRSVGYEKGVLEIEFMGGAVYQYTGPGIAQIHEMMMKATSVGQFFERYIRFDSALKVEKVK